MSCYFRHLRDVFTEAGIDISIADKKKADRIIHEIMGLENQDCPHAWKAVKVRLSEDRDGFVAELRVRWAAK